MAPHPWEDLRMDQHKANRTDDADARGEHQYDRPHAGRSDDGDDAPPRRAPNSYAAGENGTQQVTTPPTAPSDRKDEPHR